jgi:hypothetical protein
MSAPFALLHPRHLLSLRGPDRVRFLNGQMTNDCRKVPSGAQIPACILSAKGKIQFTLHVNVRPRSVRGPNPLRTPRPLPYRGPSRTVGPLGPPNPASLPRPTRTVLIISQRGSLVPLKPPRHRRHGCLDSQNRAERLDRPTGTPLRIANHSAPHPPWNPRVGP